MRTVTELEIQPQSPDVITFLARVFFLIGLIVAAILCWRVEKTVMDLAIRWSVAASWVSSIVVGMIVWKAPKRNQMTKPTADLLLTIFGSSLMVASTAIDELARYASSTVHGLK